MKQLMYLFLIVSVTARPQEVFNFEDDDLTNWIQIPESHWEISDEFALMGNKSLHHSFDNPDAATDYISLELFYPDREDTISFAFQTLHGYNPSSGNNWQFFCMSNHYLEMGEHPDLQDAMLMGVNFNTSDDILKLWQLSEGNVFEILNTGLNYQEEIGPDKIANFKLTRYPSGEWVIEYKDANESDAFKIIGTGQEKTMPKGKFMGIRYSYTSSQDRKLWVDQFIVEGTFFRDTVPPRVKSLELISQDEMEIVFSETIQTADSSRFIWNKLKPVIMEVYGNVIRLSFDNDFPNRENQALHLQNIVDFDGNVLQDTIIDFMQDLATFGDIVINEILPDPEPAVYLPECEFVELFNRYRLPVELKEWKLDINGRYYLIPEIRLLPGEYLVLTSDLCITDYQDVRALSVFSSSSALPNSEAIIKLFDQYNRLIHFVEYRNIEYYDAWRAEGGWSLERIDPDNICGEMDNWNFSFDPNGGTPGGLNSQDGDNKDIQQPELIYTGIPGDQLVSLHFSEPVLIQKKDEVSFKLNKEILDYEYFQEPLAGTDINLAVNKGFLKNEIYNLMIEDLHDCSGNFKDEIRASISIPSPPSEGNLLINELMYDPYEGGSEYIELYNLSGKYVDLRDLKIRTVQEENDGEFTLSLSEDSHLLLPGGLVVFCKNSYALRNEWALDWSIDVVELSNWKALPDGGACIDLMDRAGGQIDQICYNDSMHSDYLGITTGVSLERISRGSCALASDCWTSAATAANYGTPGSLNSQNKEVEVSESQVLLVPEVFSPDNDGFEDILVISLSAEYQYSILEIYITNLQGIEIKNIVSKGFTGSGDEFFWDGTDQDGHLAFPGIYIVHIKVTTNKFVKRFRKACAIAYR